MEALAGTWRKLRRRTRQEGADTFRREHQPAEYVTRLEIEECARILAESQSVFPSWRTSGMGAGSARAKKGLRGGDPSLDAERVVRDRKVKRSAKRRKA